MSEDNYQQQNQRAPQMLADRKWRITGQPVNGARRPPTLQFGFKKNDVTIDVWTNVDNDKDKGRITTSISPVDFFGFLNHFRRAVETGQGEFALKVSVEKWDQNSRRFEAKPDGKIVVSRTEDGVWHIALISWDNSRPMIRFPLTLSKKAQLVNSQGEPLAETEVSRAVALGLIEVLYELIPHLLQQNYEPPKPRDPNAQQGGGRSGQGGYNRGGGNGGGYQNRDNGGGGYGGYGGGNNNSGNGGYSQPNQGRSDPNDWSSDSLPM